MKDRTPPESAPSPLERELVAQAAAARTAPSPDLARRIQTALPSEGERGPVADRRPSRPPRWLLPLAAAAAALLLWSGFDSRTIPSPSPAPANTSAREAVIGRSAPAAGARGTALPAIEGPLVRELAHLSADATRAADLLRSTLALPRRALAQAH